MNKHLGAEGAMSPGRVQGPEGAKTIVLSYKTTAGAVASVIKHKLLLTCYTNEHTGRRRLDAALTSGKTARAQHGAKKKLIYDAIPHSLSDLNPAKCGMRATTRDRQQWAANMLKRFEQLPDVENIFTSQEGAKEFMDTTYQDIPMQHDTGRDIN
jgi:hypothetical protein